MMASYLMTSCVMPKEKVWVGISVVVEYFYDLFKNNNKTNYTNNVVRLCKPLLNTVYKSIYPVFTTTSQVLMLLNLHYS